MFMIKKNNMAQINPNQISLQTAAKDNIAQMVQNQKQKQRTSQDNKKDGSSSQNFRLSIRPAGTGVTGNGPITPSAGIQKIQFFNMNKAIPKKQQNGDSSTKSNNNGGNINFSDQKISLMPKQNHSALANYSSQQQPASKAKVIKLKPQQVSTEPTNAYISQTRSPQNILSGANFVKFSNPGTVYKHFNPKTRHSLPVSFGNGGALGGPVAASITPSNKQEQL